MKIWKDCEVDDVSHSAAHHLLAIAELDRQYGGWVRVSDIVRNLDINRSWQLGQGLFYSVELRSLANRYLWFGLTAMIIFSAAMVWRLKTTDNPPWLFILHGGWLTALLVAGYLEGAMVHDSP